jgi:hypothetical protein
MIGICKGHNNCKHHVNCYHSKPHNIKYEKYFGNCWNVNLLNNKIIPTINEMCTCVSLTLDRKEKLEKLKNE